MTTGYVRQVSESQWSLGNGGFELAVQVADGAVLAQARCGARAWPVRVSPIVIAGGETYQAGTPGMVLGGIDCIKAVDPGTGATGPALRLNYTCANDLQVCHYLAPAPKEPVWRSWTSLTNPAGQTVDCAITRFDAFNVSVGVSAAEPQSAYLLGWLDTPRADAPGRPPIPFKFTGWIPKLIYGDKPPTILPPPAAGWHTPTLRLIIERLTLLPLRSGKRGTYDTHPWATVLDTGAGAGFFAGFEWSGTWKMDVAHNQDDCTISAFACADTYTHALKPGETLVSPPAFVGLFEGDFDDAFNACRAYVRDNVLPPPPIPLPTVHYVMFPGGLTQRNPIYYPELSDMAERTYRLIDAAADMGAESFLLDSKWWGASGLDGDFSIGLGDFTVDRYKFPDGLKAVSDYIHKRGMVFGLWFEFERVDIRTANLGRNPWKPEWLVHQKGYPYRSWGQHFFQLCLGVQAAAEWARENIAWAIREYGVDWFMIDSNEWAACDDPTHDHGAGDGEWAQIQGLYYLLRELRREFPKLIVDNGAGGSQRGDFGMARLCDVMPCSDINVPSTINRQYSHGYGAIYPVYYARQGVLYYPTTVTGPVSRTDPTSFSEPYDGMVNAPDLTPERAEWRYLCRIMGIFQPIHDLGRMTPADMAVLKKVIATYKQMRDTLHGDRYVLTAPPEFVERENREHGGWEAYEHLSLDRKLVAVLFYRCLSTKPEHPVRLRGLDPSATYRAEFHTGRPAATFTGAELMERGFTCSLDRTRSAEVMILRRQA
jgi:alpha-galactosidase